MRRMILIGDDEIDFRHTEKYRHDPELMEAYHCGHKEGRKEAYKEIMEEQYLERRHMGRDNIAYRDRWRDEPPMMREHEHAWREPEPDEIGWRRHRDSRGRFI